MARTQRNRSSLPKGWTVRDDGMPYHNGNDCWGNALWEKDNNWANHLTRTGKWEDILPQTRTSGWLSW